MATAGKLRRLLVAVILAPLTSCGREGPGRAPDTRLRNRTGVTEVEPIESGRVVAGQTLYVPAYSSILTSVRADAFDLAVTLSVRNTDPNHPIVVTSARYYDQDGKVIRDCLKKPLRVGPMASTEFFVAEDDRSGGVSSSFLVEWVADRPVNAPLVESVMIGTASTQGVSFTCPGRVLADRSPREHGTGAAHPVGRPESP